MLLCGIIYLTLNEKEDSGQVVTEHFSESTPSENETAEKRIYIHICGEVKKPGVYTFDKEPRVIEVVEKAGGFTKKAEESSINLAEIVADGTRVEIAAKGKRKTKKTTVSRDGSANQVNINTATKEELMTIGGIGESKATQIISYRETNGPFQKIEDIMNISGIKEGIFSKIKDYMTVS